MSTKYTYPCTLSRERCGATVGFYVKCHDKVYVQKYYFGDSMNNILSSTSFVKQSSFRDTWSLKASNLQSTRAFYRNVGKWDPRPEGLQSTDELFPGPGCLEGISISIHAVLVCLPGR